MPRRARRSLLQHASVYRVSDDNDGFTEGLPCLGCTYCTLLIFCWAGERGSTLCFHLRRRRGSHQISSPGSSIVEPDSRWFVSAFRTGWES